MRTSSSRRHGQQGLHRSAWWGLWFLFWLRGATATTSRRNHDRRLPFLALYNLPPFSVTFRTQATDSLLEVIDALDSNLLSETDGINSNLGFPMRHVTQEFLVQEFQTNIAALDPDSSPHIYQFLEGVELTLQLYVSARSVRGRGLANTVTLVAEMNPELAFGEPEDVSAKPGNDEVRELFGTWLEEIFSTHRDEYLRELVQADQDLLREISALEVQTNIYEGTSGDSFNNTKYASGWSERTEKALLTLVVLLGVLGLGWMGLYWHQRHKHSRLSLSEDEDDEVHSLSLEPPRNRATSMDALRHGTDTFHRSSITAASSAMEATDRYLSKHRPDLYKDADGHPVQVFGRQYVIPSNPFEYIYQSFANSSSQNPNPISPNAAMSPNSELFVSPGGAFSTPRRSSLTQPRRSSLEVQRENIAASAVDASHFDDEAAFEEDENEPIVSSTGHWASGGGYRPISSIWRNLSNAFQEATHRPPTAADGLAVYSEEIELSNASGDYYHDEVPDENYNFAFRDFPRHDGTPCLIFSDQDDLQDQQNRIFSIGNTSQEEADDLATTPVSDDAFKKMLSQHSFNSSFEDVQFDPDDNGEEKKTDNTSNPAKTKAFQEKLSHLMETKFRRYEQKSIIEKHQRKRAKERKQVREQERKERHMAMEREIEEIEAAYSNPIERHRYSPKPNRYNTDGATFSPKGNRSNVYSSMAASPARQSFSPKVQQRYNPAFSPNRTHRIAPASPHRGIGRSRSYQESDVDQQPRYRPSGGRLSPHRSGPSSAGSYRPEPKTIFHDILQSDSQDMRDNSGFRMRPRPPTQQHPSDAMTTDLFMPAMGMPPHHHNGVAGTAAKGPKYPSPQGVADEIMMKHGQHGSAVDTRSNQSPHLLHRRVNSFDAKAHRQTIETKPLPPTNRRTPSKQPGGHRRVNSQTNSNHRRSRSHTRSQSFSEDDVFLHGIVAQTRFV